MWLHFKYDCYIYREIKLKWDRVPLLVRNATLLQSRWSTVERCRLFQWLLHLDLLTRKWFFNFTFFKQNWSAAVAQASYIEYPNISPRLYRKNWKFFKISLSVNFQKRLENKDWTKTGKFRSLPGNSCSRVRVLLYRIWAIETLTLSIYSYFHSFHSFWRTTRGDSIPKNFWITARSRTKQMGSPSRVWRSSRLQLCTGKCTATTKSSWRGERSGQQDQNPGHKILWPHLKSELGQFWWPQENLSSPTRWNAKNFGRGSLDERWCARVAFPEWL